MRAIPKIKISKAVDDEETFELEPVDRYLSGGAALDAIAIMALVWSAIEEEHSNNGSSWPIREISTNFTEALWIEFSPRPGRVKEARAIVRKHFRDAIKTFTMTYAIPAAASAEPLPFAIDHLARTKPATMKEASR